jgi:hypothetical protein
MTITTAGNVGVGTTTPTNVTNYKFITLNAATGANYQAYGASSTDARVFADNAYGGTGMFSNHPFLFYTNSSERMRIDSSGNVGIGTSSPGDLLQLGRDANNYFAIGNNGSTDALSGIQWRFGSGNTALARIASASSGTNATYLAFSTATSATLTERMRIDSSGRVGIATSSPEASLQVNGINGQLILSAGNAPSSGASTNKWRIGLRELVEGDFNILHFNGTSYDNIVNIQPAGQARFINTIGVGNTSGSTSGAGITFPATQSASSDANTLDDYEEGTFTPSYSTDGVNFSSITYGARLGTYTKIGRVVSMCIELTMSAITKGSASGNVIVTGLPFTAQSFGQGFYGVTGQCNSWNTPPGICKVASGASVVTLFQGFGTNNAFTPVGDVSTGENRLQVTLVYQV